MFIEPFGVRVPFPRFLRLRKVSQVGASLRVIATKYS
jgi:hypothetical protein